jgi:hypothetical protein
MAALEVLAFVEVGPVAVVASASVVAPALGAPPVTVVEPTPGPGPLVAAPPAPDPSMLGSRVAAGSPRLSDVAEVGASRTPERDEEHGG